MIRAYLTDSNPVHDYVIKAFAEGCGATLVSGWRYEPSEVAIVFGVRKERVPASYPRGEIIKQQEKRGGKTIVLETGYVNRGSGRDHHYAAGWGGLNGRADFRNGGMSPDRWRALGVELQPWRDGGKFILVCGQIPWDAACQHHNHIGWCQAVVARLGRTSPVVFRPHPLATGVNYGVRGCEISTRPLEEDLAEASCVVTFNSNTGVDAVIAGVPAVSMDDGSMARAVTGHSLDDLTHQPDREQWAADLAFSQWTPDEMRSGEAWAHVSR